MRKHLFAFHVMDVQIGREDGMLVVKTEMSFAASAYKSKTDCCIAHLVLWLRVNQGGK